ncbi:SipW-dependent-type signal peptide-containing protein [Aeromicrobium duanguangcaii]|uniref:SipW-dependent-type signal peptide-containing protein n=1 Tax=Aeromicrobium duanguangcaii TaxID=2968086 RepID=A0ABY5KKY2_9ACTN|nr:SipW-dependent-type signal peptide-containing protein [Aeromicrobium duanguangcaii]MCD9153081.1 SipW-dependent-type signal peptide-containing protein [Aeromicrobium duanguangcaii]MCL3836924.1 SipW-dependent-type signal peptide-containing protein [Aeromicrobium duanguangcaii]UUI69817.1 SipW-dependent-type signal peptide-containing protein [Aeromicrobium duanguangcaii]
MRDITATGRARLRTAWRAIASVQVRLLLSLGLVLGFAAVGTTAYWADTAIFTTGKIEAGHLDLQLGGRNPQTGVVEWSAVGLDQNWNYSVLQLDNVSPGESVAMELHIRNVGTTPLTFTGVGSSTSDDLSPYLSATTRLGGVAGNTGTREAVNRTGTCSAGTATWWDAHPLSTTPRAVTPNNARVTLAANGSMQVCMLAGLAANTPNTYQGRSTTIKVVLNAKQVGAP